MPPSPILCFSGRSRKRKNVFRKFLEDNKFPSTALVSGFTRQHALAFMDMVEENLSPKTFNNYIGFFRGLWAWMMEKGYADANPFDGIENGGFFI